jgi:hypothetical protein
MRRRVCLAWLVVIMGLSGCAAGSHPPPAAEEWPSGPGTIPPSWYDYNPALKPWYDPWFHNPYIAR